MSKFFTKKQKYFFTTDFSCFKNIRICSFLSLNAKPKIRNLNLGENRKEEKSVIFHRKRKKSEKMPSLQTDVCRGGIYLLLGNKRDEPINVPKDLSPQKRHHVHRM